MARRARPSWRWAAASLALAAAVTAGLLLPGGSPEVVPAPPAAPAPAALSATASPGDVLVLWLDADTPLYLTLPAADAAEEPRRPR